MNRRIDWGAGILILLLIAGGAFVFYSQHNELQQLKQQASFDVHDQMPLYSHVSRAR